MVATAATEDPRAAALRRAYAAVAAVSSEDEAQRALAIIRLEARRLVAARWEPYPWQRPHRHPEGFKGVCGPDCFALPAATIPAHGTWLQLGGRGTGKTDGIARYVNEHVEGPACDPRAPGGHRPLIIAPTQTDAVVSCVTGLSGLQTINPAVRIVTGREGTLAIWPNGAKARLLGAYTKEDEERLRSAGNTCLVWLEEAAAMRHLGPAREHAGFGLRVGPRPHFVASTTPKPRKEVRDLVDDPGTVITRGKTEDAVHLEAVVRDALLEKHAGTRLGRQELGGELLDDVEGALWVHDARLIDDPEDDRPGIEEDRVMAGAVASQSHNPDAPTPKGAQLVSRCVVSVDPSGGGSGDEAGVLVLGSIGNHGYVLADLSGHMSSDRWARRAVQAYYDFGAEGIALEKYGGDNATNTLKTIVLSDGRRGADVPIFPMPTKVGKRLRAEPVTAIYEQHRVHHVGLFPELEDQMTSWVPDETPDSPDRVDALVHGLTYLLVRTQQATSSVPTGRIATPQRRIR